jgi:indoleamine 2,3-dioxygenase
MAQALKLDDYDIDAVRGFLPNPDPLEHLPQAFAAWDRIAAQLPLLIMAGRVLSELADLPELDASRLADVRERRRALLLLTGFANTWVVAGGGLTLPRTIAVPLVATARNLDQPPITAHATIVLGNWRRIDPARPLSLDNIDTLLSFRGSIDEKWFFLSTVGVELVGAPVLADLVVAVAAAQDAAPEPLAAALEKIAARLELTTAAFLRVRESCDPYIFYKHVRPFLAGWPAPGMLYQGTDLGPVQFNGGSAAQSSLLQAVDAALGIRHDHASTRTFLQAMRQYMPPRHRAFIATLSERSCVRAVAAAPGAPQYLRQAYDDAVAAMDSLRRKHIGLVSEYITRQMPPNASAIGTGGTPFDDFLRQARVETVNAKLGAARTAKTDIGNGDGT